MSDSAAPSEPSTETKELSSHDLEKLEEEKLKAKFPAGLSGLGRGGPGGHSAFLQKRLAKGQQKFFDSGDYQMAKQKMGQAGKQALANKVIPTGDAIPTPETVPVRKTSIIQQKFNISQS
uniref:Putative regulator of atp-sensitive k+ chanel alpha-endosulfine/arpp-19 n=1 Tax=Xenopsylla cheopis TaxID=163159 RepID=A0A6M2DQ33_XENCH